VLVVVSVGESGYVGVRVRVCMSLCLWEHENEGVCVNVCECAVRASE
jgi:hypothetical protein